MTKKIIGKKELDVVKVAGIKMLSDIVGGTLGPAGNPVLCERVGQALDGTPLKPRITKDGVSVANECSSPDPIVDVILQTVKAICQKTNVDAGDGTTTAIILGNAILTEALAYGEEHPGISPQKIKKSLDKVGIIVENLLKEASWPIQSYDDVKEVATISSNGDQGVGKVIADAFAAVGAEGVVTVDEGGVKRLSLERVKGYRFLRGAQGREAFFNNATLSAYEAEDVAIVLYDGAIRSQTELFPFLEQICDADDTGRMQKDPPPIVIIANEFSRDVIQWMLIQKAEAGVVFCPVIGPNVSHVRTQYYEDIAVYVGGKRLGNGEKNLLSITASDIGMVGKIEIDEFKTTLYDGQGTEEDIIKRVDVLKAKRAAQTSPYDIQGINDRIAALTGGIAKILIGGDTELALKELYDRVEDAINASRAAIREGVVIGGGTALLRVAHKLPFEASIQGEIGVHILKKALQYPHTQILDNAGISPDEQLTIKRLISTADESEKSVYDVENNVYVNAIKAGIIDPVLVTRSAFKNALSISGLLLTAGGAIVIEKKEEE